MNFGSWFKGLRTNLSRVDYSFFYQLGGKFKTNTISDSEAIEYGYLTNSAWYSIASTVTEGVTSLPIRLGVVNSQGEVERVTQGEVYDWFFRNGKEQTLSELWELNSLYYLCNGEFFELFDRESVGFMDGKMYSLPPQCITILTDNEESIISNVTGYEFQDNAKNVVYLPEEILHCRMPNPSVLGRREHNGLSPLQAGQNILNSSNNIETAISWYFENRGVSNLISGDVRDGMALTKDDKSMIETALNGRLGGAHKMNRNIVTSTPINNVYNLSASSTDMQMIENYNLVLQRLCALIKLPSILVNDNEQSTYNNVVEAKKQAYTEVYIPMAEKFIRAYERKWLKMWSERTGQEYVLYIAESEIKALQNTPLERRKEAREDVARGIITRNEARQAQGLDTLDIPEMDIPSVQSGTIPVETIDNGNI